MSLPECLVTVNSITLEIKDKEDNWVDPSSIAIKDIFSYSYDLNTGHINALQVKMSLDYFMTTFLAYSDNNEGTVTNLDFQIKVKL